MRQTMEAALWQIKGVISWSLSKWPYLSRSMLIGVSSYHNILFKRKLKAGTNIKKDR